MKKRIHGRKVFGGLLMLSGGLLLMFGFSMIRHSVPAVPQLPTPEEIPSSSPAVADAASIPNVPHKTTNVTAQKKYTDADIKSVMIGGENLSVQVARTDIERSEGLSGRTELADNEGMLFVFDTPGAHPFWMKDMNFSLDIVWVSKDMKVLYIKENATPESYPDTYGPDAESRDAVYVLEAVSGFSERNNLKVGDTVEFKFSS